MLGEGMLHLLNPASALFAGFVYFAVPLTENPQPIDEIAPAVAARRAIVRPNREVNPPSRLQQFIGDLYSRRTRSDHQHGPQRSGAGGHHNHLERLEE